MSQDNREKVLKNAQYRKGLSIAFFNSTNAAIELSKTLLPALHKGDTLKEDAIQRFITKWRDFFLTEHQNYYATVIANVGVNYNVEEAVKKLRASKAYKDLSGVWLLFSEDERRDPEIVRVAKEMKAKLKNAKEPEVKKADPTPKVETPKKKRVTKKVAKNKDETPR